MSNRKVVVKATVTYIDADGQTADIPTKTLEPEYTDQIHGTIGVAAEAGATDYDVPFGTIAKATCVMVENKLGQVMDVSVNDGALNYTGLANGKSVMLCLPATPDAAITAVKCTTLATQTADGLIGYHVWGDPAAT